MIVNKYSILMLFMAALGLALASVLAVTALWAAWRIRRSRGELETSGTERSIHLATLVAVVCLAILLIGWPLFYAMLDSFVPEIPGAMCIYGVTRVMPVATALVQAATPALIFLLGAWLLLEHVRRQSGIPPRKTRGMLALAVAAGLLAFAHGAEVYYVGNMNSLKEVSCCCGRGEHGGTQLQAPAYYLPWELASPTSRVLLNTLFFAAVPALALWLVAQSRRHWAPCLLSERSETANMFAAESCPRQAWAWHPFYTRGFSLARGAALLAVAVGLTLASLLEFSEVLAPLLMRLPFHHCLYCLLFNGRAPDSPLIVGNVMIGGFAAGWAAVLEASLPMDSSQPAALHLHRRLCAVGATGLLASVLMVIIHLAVYHG